MAVDVKGSGRFVIGLHPASAQMQRLDLGRIAGAERIHLFSQTAHLGAAIQAQKVAQFAGGDPLQPLNSFDPTKGHEGQEQQDLENRIVAFDFSKQLLSAFQKTIGQQRRQGAQNAAVGHVQTRLKPRFRAVDLTHRRQGPVHDPRAGGSHAFGGNGVLGVAGGFVGTLLVDFDALQLLQPTVVYGLAKGVGRHSEFFSCVFSAETVVQQ